MPEALEGEAVAQRLDIDVCRSLDRPTIIRAEEDATEAPLGTLVGEFTLFGEWYEINSLWEGHFIERTMPGAFKRTINNRSGQSPVRVLLEHGFDPTVADKPLGVPSILEERATGVYAETPLLDTSYNRDLAPALAAGAYGQSFRFQVLRDEFVEPGSDGWEDTGNPAWANLPQRNIYEVRLIEFGPTVFPASPATNATTGVRSSTDAFYEQLARRDEARYEAAVRSVRGLRSPATAPADAPAADTQRTDTEDPHVEPVEDPAATQARHSEAEAATHSTETTTTRTPSKKETVMANMTIEERAARLEEIEARLQEIDKANETTGELRSEDQSEWDGLVVERDEHARALKAHKERQEYLRTITANKGAGESHETVTERATRQAPAVNIKPENIYDVAAIRSRAGSPDEAHRLYLEHAKRAVEVATFPGVANRSAAQEQVSALLEKLDDEDGTLARRLLQTGSPLYERAFGKAALKGIHTLNPEEQRALTLGTDTAGGFAVPFQLDPTIILTSNGVINPLRSISRVVQITGKVWEGLTSAGVTVSRSAEAAEATDNSPALAQPTVSTSRVEGFIPFSYELEYSWAQLRTEMTMLLSDAKDAEEADAFVNGNGTAPNPQGVLTGATTVVLTASGTALTRADLYKVKNQLPPRWRANASWLADGSFFDQCRELSQNGDIVGGGLENGGPDRLLNKPAYEASAMPDYTGALNGIDAILGDFSQFVIVDRVGMSVELIPQVFGSNQRPTGQRGIFALWMNGSKVLVPNAFRVLKQAAS